MILWFDFESDRILLFRYWYPIFKSHNIYSSMLSISIQNIDIDLFTIMSASTALFMIFIVIVIVLFRNYKISCFMLFITLSHFIYKLQHLINMSIVIILKPFSTTRKRVICVWINTINTLQHFCVNFWNGLIT